MSSRSEHVPVIERRIRVIKERVRSIRNSLPFKILPKIMLIEMVKYCIKWLNVFPSKGGINNMSPTKVMVGRNIDCKLYWRLGFGTYFQTAEDHSNNLEERTTGAISLFPDESIQVGYYFYNLNTGKKIHRRQLFELPIPRDVILRVEIMGE